MTREEAALRALKDDPAAVECGLVVALNAVTALQERGCLNEVADILDDHPLSLARASL